MKRVVLLTGHYWQSERQAGFHRIARSFLKKGWEVLFFTAPISTLSILRRDHRLKYPVLKERNRIIQKEKNLYSYVWFTFLHPVNLRNDFLNNISSKLFENYVDKPFSQAENFIKKADLLIFESNPVLFLYKKLKSLCPSARFVYRVSDDLRLLGAHPSLIEFEKKLAPSFDQVSVPSRYIVNKFKGLPNLKLHKHGIDRNLFDNCRENPYQNSSRVNLIFVGQDHFDYDFLEIAASQSPDHDFHLIGPIQKRIQKDNIHYYGEKRFEETIQYLKYADIGLHTLRYSKGAESFTDSLKLIQYEYCRLPIIAPDYMDCYRPQVHYYRPGNIDSINRALEKAVKYDRSGISTDDVNNWDQLTDQLAGEIAAKKPELTEPVPTDNR